LINEQGGGQQHGGTIGGEPSQQVGKQRVEVDAAGGKPHFA